MAISYAHLGVRHARALLNDITACGVEPPTVLTELVAAFDDLQLAATSKDHPTTELVNAVAGGKLRGAALDKQIAAAAAATQVQEFRRNLQARVEPAVVRHLIKALDEGGAADAIIDSLRQPFDKAVTALRECAELVDFGANPEQFLAGATSEQIQAWQAIDEHVATLTRISSAVTHFGPQSTTFPLMELPGTVGSDVAFINNNGTLCVDPEYGIARGSELFQNHGTHRNSPWFKGASVLKLNTIAEAREKIRAWAESAWAGITINQGRGRIDPEHAFIPEPVANPFALTEPEG
ncbi:hypothetical protein MSS2_04244 [Mycobacterium marinum]|nr:hypothetical protein MSS2_04244 [Mycobacterium marinum]